MPKIIYDYPKTPGKRLTTKEFIKRARKVHGNRYDYSEVVYKNYGTKVIILCPEHGEFLQTPNNHLSGEGCPGCGKILNVQKRSSNSKNFIKKAQKVHGPKYDYSEVDYKNNNTKIIIICPVHGEFRQTPGSHLMNRGCPDCGKISQIKKQSLTTESFTKKAQKVHGSKYNYSKVDYKNAGTKVTIICPLHGEFRQTPAKHIRKQGCPRCGKNKPGQGWNYSKSRKKGILYFLTCKQGNEYFCKVGISKHSIQTRFKKCNTPFEIVDSFVLSGTIGDLYKIEQKILQKHKSAKYTPKIKFGGWTECINISARQAILAAFFYPHK